MIAKSFKLALLTTIVIICTSVFKFVFAVEINIIGQNETRYARGELLDRAPGESFGYLENYLELNTNIDKFRLYLRQGYKLPSEFGDRQAGMDAFDKRYIEYRDKHLKLRGGHFYRNWGQGLFFGNYESLELDVDTGLEGILFEGNYKKLDAALFRGVETDDEGGFSEGAEGIILDYQLPYRLKIGGGYLRLDDGPRHPSINRSGVQLIKDFDVLSFQGIYVSDKFDSEPGSSYSGFYSSTSVFGSGWGMLMEYKNYDLFTYRVRRVIDEISSFPSLQNPPTAIPEQTMPLLDRHPRIIHFYDDVGYQLEFTINRGDFNLIMNYNQSSEHDGESVVPSLEEEFSPYQGLFAHLKYEPLTGNSWILQGGMNEDVEFTKTATGGYAAWFRRYAGGAVYEAALNDEYTIQTEFELMQVNDLGFDERYWEQYISLVLSKSPHWIFTTLLERTEDTGETGGLDWKGGMPGGEGKYWISGELTLDFLEKYQANIFYGYERGGIRCTGGFCRAVSPFHGAKLRLTAHF